LVQNSLGRYIISRRDITPEANCGDGTGECSVTPTTELADDTFEWWILTQNDSGDGPWSDDGFFFTVESGTVAPGDVILDGNDNVIGIENLEVFVFPTEIKVYNVDFVDGSAIDVYGSALDFDFPVSADAVSALKAVNDALNANNPTPPGAGPQGSDQFFIGSREFGGIVNAAGGQNLSGVWGDCEDGCLAGVRTMLPDTSFTWAGFTEVAP
jgi:hypothetical protein